MKWFNFQEGEQAHIDTVYQDTFIHVTRLLEAKEPQLPSTIKSLLETKQINTDKSLIANSDLTPYQLDDAKITFLPISKNP